MIVHARADSVAIARGPHRSMRKPVVSVSLVTKNHGLAIQAIYSGVDESIIVQIAEGNAARGHGMRNGAPDDFDTSSKRPLHVAHQQQRFQIPQRGWVCSMLSITWPCATNRSFQPSLS